MSETRKPFPKAGRSWDDLSRELDSKVDGDRDWRHGRVPLFVFSGGEDVYDVGREAFFKYFSENALGRGRAFHSLKQMEDDILDFGLDLFRAPAGAGGAMTTGGSESIMVAIKVCREWARGQGRQGPFNIVAPYSAHPAFNKAGDLMDIVVRRAPLAADMRGDVDAMAGLIDESTIMLVGSAPCFSHGVIDPIGGLSELAQQRNLWLHVDACVGGYVIPFFERIGRPVAGFDFAFDGVRSISADLHKFGFCPKPASTVFVRSQDDLTHGHFDFDEWPHGSFGTPTLTGTRPGGAVAGSWAVLNYLGEEGYMEIARRLSAMVDRYVAGIEAIDGLSLISKPDITLINFGAADFDIYQVAEWMNDRGWLPGLTQRPRGMHAMLSLLHEASCDDYLTDLRDAVDDVKRGRNSPSHLTASYAD